MKKLLIPLILILFVAFFYFSPPQTEFSNPSVKTNLWSVRSIDTVKYSRDIAREKASVQEFDTVINTQVSNIAKTGANYTYF